jgi:hypothetical protein
MSKEPSQDQESGLAVKFENHISEAKKHHAEFIGCASESLKAAMLCGKALVSARETIGHGDWWKTLRTYWPEISRTTAWRLMQLADNAHLLGDLTMTKIEAYEKLGMVPTLAPETESQAKSTTITIEALAPQVSRFAQKLNDKKDAVLSWPAEDRAKLEQALKPAVDLYSSLTAMKGEVINA